MKKLFIYLSVAVLGIAAASCQKELAVAEGGKGNVTFTIQTPDAGTKAIADGTNVNVVYYEVYKAGSGHANSIVGGAPLIDSKIENFTGTATLKLNLLQNQDYVVLFWAEVAGKSYYTTTDLRTVTVNYTGLKANDEARAAFCQKLEFNSSKTYSTKVTLVRPFAQINLGTTQNSIDPVVNGYNLDVESSYMKVVGAATTFSVATMTTGSETTTVEFAANTVPHDFTPNSEELKVNDVVYAYLGMNYILAATDVATVDVTYEINTNVGSISRQIPAVPVQTNYRTNLLGNLLTQETAIEIVVDEKFNTPDLEPAPIYMAAANGGEFTLTEDVTLTEPLIIQSSLTIDLNGYTITGGKEYVSGMTGAEIAAITVENGATLTIEGNGSVTGIGYYAVYAKNGTLNVKDGNFAAKTSAVQIAAATVNIEGGTFSNSSDDKRYTINCLDGNWKDGSAKVNITGGTFVGFNPENNAAEGVGTNFCAEGYKAVEKSGAWHVVADETDVVVLTTADLTAALTAAVTAGNTSVVLDANGAEFDMNGAITKANVPAGTTVTIRNANVNARSYGNKLEGTVIYENCTFNNANGAYSIHFDGGNGHVVFKNCDLYGWNSFGKIGSVTFENCTLAGNGTYALIRSYTTMTLTDCSIDASNANHTDEYSEGVEAVEGGTMTMENISYVVYDDNSLQFALENAGVNTIYLKPREEAYIADIYNGTAARKSLTIIGSEGTKFGHTATTGGQLQLKLFDRFTISNCEIIQRSGYKTWGHIVFGASGKENGVYTIKNCTFNSNGNQGIYINETTSGAVYNIENCTFNGYFGSEDGAVTIQNNRGVAFTVNVTGCTFNMTNGSHEISHHYNDSAFTLNTDVDSSKIYCKEN